MNKRDKDRDKDRERWSEIDTSVPNRVLRLEMPGQNLVKIPKSSNYRFVGLSSKKSAYFYTLYRLFVDNFGSFSPLLIWIWPV